MVPDDAALTDGRSPPEWAPRFLRELEARGSITSAAKATGVCRRTVFNWRTRSPEFAAQVEEARHQVLGAIEVTLYQRALKGDTACLIFLAKARLGWTDRPTPEDTDLREQIEAMRGAIEELDGDTQSALLAAYKARRRPSLLAAAEDA